MCPVATIGFRPVLFSVKDSQCHFRRSQLEHVQKLGTEEGHNFGDVQSIVAVLHAIELIIETDSGDDPVFMVGRRHPAAEKGAITKVAACAFSHDLFRLGSHARRMVRD